MPKPQYRTDNKTDPHGGSGDGVTEAGVAVAEVDTGGGTQGHEAAGPSLRKSGRVTGSPQGIRE